MTPEPKKGKSTPRLRRHGRLVLQITLPLVVIAGGASLAAKMIASMEKPAVTPPPPNVPFVRVVTAQPRSMTLEVQSQGTVSPMTEVTLSAQVSGRVTSVSPKLRAGSFFAAGETLLTIDDSDYRLQVVQQRAAVARAQLRVAQERAEAEVAARAWQQLEGDRKPDALATRELFVAEAESALEAAEAALLRSELDLERTQVSLPFAGRVRTTDVDLGQFVTAGTPLGQVYGIDFAEVRLPIPDEDAAFLDLPLLPGAGADETASAPPVRLYAEFAGRRHGWDGHIVRTDGEIDRRTRQVTLIARVPRPYETRPPLAVGLFVEAAIQGRTYDGVVTLPRAALRPDGRVLVVSAENQLRAREVEVLRRDRTQVFLRQGLSAGEQVCVSRVEMFVDGMPVHILQPEDDHEARPNTDGQVGVDGPQQTGHTPAPGNGGK